MKRTGKILFSMAAAGAAISAAAFMAKKHTVRHGKPAPDTEPNDVFEKNEEYFPDFLQDGFGVEEETPAEQGIYLTADEAGFLKYILEGIENIGILTDSRIAEVEKLARKRKIPHTDRIREIKNACEGWDSDRELLQQCINDIREVLEGGFPEDFLEYVSDSQAAGSDAALS